MMKKKNELLAHEKVEICLCKRSHYHYREREKKVPLTSPCFPWHDYEIPSDSAEAAAAAAIWWMTVNVQTNPTSAVLHTYIRTDGLHLLRYHGAYNIALNSFRSGDVINSPFLDDDRCRR